MLANRHEAAPSRTPIARNAEYKSSLRFVQGRGMQFRDVVPRLTGP